METKPTISVIITTYNRPDKLKRAIKSVLDQTFQDFEIIVVDDASPEEKTKKVIEKFIKKGERRIKYIRRDKNWGSHSRPKNDGIKAASAELVAFLDDDNVYLKDHLQALYNMKQQNQHVQMVFGDRWLIDDSGQEKKAMGINPVQLEVQLGLPRSEDGWHPAILDVHNYIDTSDVLIEKKILYDLGGWNEKLKKFADWNLWVRFAKAGYKAKHVPLAITEYHIHADMAQLRHKSLVDKNGRNLPTFSPDGDPIFAEETSLVEKKPLRVCVLTVAWNRLDYTKRTVETMNETAKHGFDHIMFLQEPKDEEIEWVLGRKPSITFITSEKNKGVPYAYNKMIEAMEEKERKGNFRYDIVVTTDNDVDFTSEGWLAEIVDLFERQRKLIVSPYIEGLRDNPGGAPRSGWKEFGIPPRGYVGKHLLGFPRFMGNIVNAFPRRFFDDFEFKVDTFLHGTQSKQVANAAFSRGFVLAYMEQIRVEHMDTTTGQAKEYPEETAKALEAKTIKFKSDERLASGNQQRNPNTDKENSGIREETPATPPEDSSLSEGASA